MANEEHLKLLKQGAKDWNLWRVTFKGRPDLRQADLERADLSRANLSKAMLTDADLGNANLYKTNFSGAGLHRAYMNGADLTEAKLGRTRMHGAHICDARLYGANLGGANLSRATLQRSNLEGGDLSGANLNRANLSKANLRGVNLCGASLTETLLGDSDFTGAVVGGTIFAHCDLSAVKGLETAIHLGPSTIGLDTLFLSDGKIPRTFLLGAGVPEDFITFVPSLIGRAIEFYSCFISYNHQDEEFAKRLHSRMRAESLRVWYAPEDMKGGRKLHEEIFSAIQIHDKLLLVLSGNSMKSEWVMSEIRRAKKVEREENRRKLFPIRLVEFETIEKWECFDADSGKDLAIELREYYIPDFSNWKDHDAFEEEFAKLLRDLKATQT